MCFGPFVPWNMGTALHFGRDLAIIALPLWWSHLKPRNYALLATAAKRRSRFANASLNNPSSSRILFILLENEMCFSNKQSRFVWIFLVGFLGHPFLRQYTWRCPCIYAVMEEMHEVSFRALDGCRVTSKRPSKETREFTKENNIMNLPSYQAN